MRRIMFFILGAASGLLFLAVLFMLRLHAPQEPMRATAQAAKERFASQYRAVPALVERRGSAVQHDDAGDGLMRLFDQAERRRQAMSIRVALERAGMPPFKLSDAERQLKQIGRPRARQLYRWLLAADLELKGYNSTKDRARRVIETLIVRLSQHANAPAAR